MARLATPTIALLTDFGTAGWYVACLKAVILRICPQAHVVDISHEIPPQDIPVGALTLAAAASWFPAKTVFVGVVDPGVGTSRRLLAAQADAYRFVGPDNGLLGLVLARAKRLSLVHLTNPRYWLPETSQTFQGRDIMAPVAAHLARGCPLRRLGVPVNRYQSLRLPPLQREGKSIRGCILYTDSFGNLITNLPVSLVADHAPVQVRYRRMPVRVVSSYAEGRDGELVALCGSSGYLELAIRNGSAAWRYQARRDEPVSVSRS